MLQLIAAGVVAAVTGFASSFALVVAGLGAVGASPVQAASGLLALCVLQGVLAMVLSLRYRIPLSFAWSTPGAALLLASGATGDFSAAVGAFLVSGVLIVLTGLWPALGRAITGIPRPLASAMLAGILFPICVAPVTASIEVPWLALPVIAVWVLLHRFAPRWATPGAMAATAIAIAASAGTAWLTDPVLTPTLTLTPPAFDPVVLVSLGVPLYIVTMAGQNVPGFAVLTTFGYSAPPRPVLVGTGVASAIGSFAGAFVVNLAAITAAIMAGPDSHPDPRRRWLASFTGGATYVVLGLGAGLMTALVAASPPILITAAAGLALLGALVTAIVSALEDERQRIVAIATFLVVASNVQLLGIGSAFWGLVVGGILLLMFRRPREPEPTAAAT
ncbi:benzoate/H(+) symporter BenE family transporter [Lysobacter korlensis]|uniref:Benzoate/H(+) symporter BenE family transporter n=1 Tax=Lysobacter korlensis TaxID=553636 RepID=A0ABV6RN18_9GAMM